ncbi:AraC family transcriptional regulator [Streptomyces sp. SID3343]|uniref:helix-turn-helix domain-containing protein n=1 Tax=Streptomyces sp. SID3343 TaxID=2690260 RepID=UPI00136974DC|nr:AraC family transcriptional regulator [Streptomyces sp. SID3343]MYW03109.1 helix-turn-helix domain-containing protein [Streptomyces sp. SID3343]
MTLPHRPRGVLRADVAPGEWDVNLYDPAPDIAPYVEYYWIVRWDRRGQSPYRQQVLSHPNVHLVFEEPHAAVYGIVRSVFTRELVGAGHVFGIRFRAGGFRPFLGGPVADLADRVVPAAELFGPKITRVSDTVLATADELDRVASAETYLRSILPAPTDDATVPDPLVAEVAAIVARLTANPDLFRVDDVAEEAGMSVRRLQRLFAEYVGANPKWVLRRARLLEVAERARRGVGVDWAGLAADLGYADQAHLTRDFTATVGAPPARYAKAGPGRG